MDSANTLTDLLVFGAAAVLAALWVGLRLAGYVRTRRDIRADRNRRPLDDD